MTCCGKDNVVENWALNKKFYVCRECKKEVSPEPPTTPTLTVETYPPTPLSVEFVGWAEELEQLELFDKPWISGNTLSNIPYKERSKTNGKKT